LLYDLYRFPGGKLEEVSLQFVINRVFYTKEYGLSQYKVNFCVATVSILYKYQGFTAIFPWAKNAPVD
jgi:hypothetical protein